VITTGNDPVAPLETTTVAALTEKSHAVPFRATDCGLPFAVDVTEIELETGPGVVDESGAKATVKTHALPPGETERMTGRVAHELFVIVNGAFAGSEIADTVTGVTVLGLLIVIVCVGLVDVKSCPANVRLVGMNWMAAAVVLPFPLSATSIGWFMPSIESKI
jgi:hypothetical protein